MTGFGHARWRSARASSAIVVAVALGAATVPGVPGVAGAQGRPASVDTVVRVDQAGYPDRGPKVAEVMASAPLSGMAAVDDSSGRTLARVPLGRSVGAWSAAWPDVYRVDFSAVTRDGTDTLRVGRASSPPFRLAPAGSVYAGALDNALSFYQDERDGPDYIPSALRSAPGHLNDEHASTFATPTVNGNGQFHGDLTPLGGTIDASGGWWDAGDYLKFVETTSYTVGMMLEGVRSFPDQMGAGAGPKADFTAEARFGLDWLLEMWDQSSRTLYDQVGIGAGNTAGTIVSDHDIWRLPQVDDTYGGTSAADRYIRHRPVVAAGAPGSPISPNLAGRLAADFGLCYQVFRTSDPGFAATCLTDGETVYAQARTTDVGRLTTAIPWDFYPETTWQDDMELGATELSTALADGGATVAGLPQASAVWYLGQAAGWARAYIDLGPGTWSTLNLYDTAGLAHDELDRAIGAAGDPSSLAVTPAELVANLQALIGIGVRQSRRTPFANGAAWNNSDSVSLKDGVSVMASEYDALTGTSTYADQAQGWLDDNLGANPWGLSFLVGDGSASPDCLSHQVANLAGSLHGDPPVLAGAAVEGPDAEGTRGFVPGMRACSVDRSAFDSHAGEFVDTEQSYNTTEPAIDLTASSPLALAWRETSG